MKETTPLMAVSVARQRLLQRFSPLGEVEIPILEADERFLAEDVISEIDFPPFSNSGMDGFALRSSDITNASTSNPIDLKVIEDIPAGKIPKELIGAGQTSRIMTGAAVPEGADVVVPVEETNFSNRSPGVLAPNLVKIYSALEKGKNIRPVGNDFKQGDIVLNKGMRIRPQEIGMLAMLGIKRIQVYKRPKVAIFSTGDELIEVGERLLPGTIYDSNGFMLSALVEKYGGEPIRFGIISDQYNAVLQCFETIADQHVDLIISSAGVSVGAFDFVRNVLENEGSLEFWRVNMRPGKPLAFGRFRDIPFIGLPGNPVSAFVGFEVFIVPALQKMLGKASTQQIKIRAKLLDAIESDGRESYLRAIAFQKDDEFLVRLTGHQGSGNLRSLVQANAILFVPSGVKSLPSGSQVDIWLLDKE